MLSQDVGADVPLTTSYWPGRECSVASKAVKRLLPGHGNGAEIACCGPSGAAPGPGGSGSPCGGVRVWLAFRRDGGDNCHRHESPVSHGHRL